ncbi:MAG: YIP1 family protein [Gemmatimonadota bacterium]|nr:MAG: YIP1 family protein [Gemmatimonadota bacterium]
MTDATPTDQSWPAWKLALRVIDEPAEAFRQLAGRPQVLIPIILLIITAAFVGIATPAATLQDQAQRRVEAVEQRNPNLDEEARARMQQQVEGASSMTSRAIIFVAGSILGLIALVVVASVLMLIFGAQTADALKFKDEFAITTHAYVPQLLGAVLLVLLAIFGLENLQLTLGFLFDEDSSSFLYNLANQFGLFGAWNIYLLALGNQIRIGAKGIGGPLAVVGGLWVLVNLAFAAAATFFGGLAG